MAEVRNIPGVGLVRKNDDGTFEVMGDAPAPQGKVFTLPQSGEDAKADARQAADDARKAEEAARKAAEFNERNAPTLPKGYQWKNGVPGDAELIPGVQPPRGATGIGGRPALTAGLFGDSIAAYTAASDLDKLADDLQAKFDAGPGTTSGIRGVQDYLPFSENRVFNDTANRARGTIKTAFGFTGGENNTIAEAEMNYGPFLPQASDSDEKIKSRIAALRGLAASTREKTIRTLGGVPDANGRITPVPEPVANTAPALAVGNDVSRGEQVLTQQMNDLYNKGASPEELIGFLQQNKKPVDRAKALEIYDAVDKRGQGRPVRFVPNSDLSGEEGRFQGLKAGALSAVDTGMMGLSDEVTAGINSTISGTDYDAELSVGDAGKKSLFAEEPGAAITGAIAGSIIPGMGLARASQGLLRQFPNLARFTKTAAGNPNAVLPVAESALFGAGYGAGTDNDNRLGGAAWGGAAGIVGGAGGTLVSRAAGGVMGGIWEGAKRRLLESGVNLSPGQMLGGGGIIGRSIKGLEDASESIPVLKSVIQRAREESFQDVNRVANNQGMAGIGARIDNVGEAGVDDMADAVHDAFGRTLDNRTFNVDPTTQAALSQARTIGLTSRQFGQTFDDHIDNDILPIFSQPGVVTGREFQDANRTLGGLSRQYDKLAVQGANGVPAPTARVARDAFDDMNDAFSGMIQRQAPDVLDDYGAAQGAYRNMKVLQEAVNRGRNGSRSGTPGVWTPSQLSDAAAANARRFGGTQGTPQQPFYQLTRDAQEVLPSSLPNSGTADRVMSAALLASPTAVAGGAAAGGYIDPETAAIIAGLSAAYTRPGMSAMRIAATAARPTVFQNGSRALADNPRLGALLGASVSTPLLLGRQ